MKKHQVPRDSLVNRSHISKKQFILLINLLIDNGLRIAYHEKSNIKSLNIFYDLFCNKKELSFQESFIGLVTVGRSIANIECLLLKRDFHKFTSFLKSLNFSDQEKNQIISNIRPL